jgi:hypothetical protein
LRGQKDQQGDFEGTGPPNEWEIAKLSYLFNVALSEVSDAFLLNEYSPHICEVDILVSPHLIKEKVDFGVEIPDSTRDHVQDWDLLDDQIRGILCCFNRPLILGVSPFTRCSRASVLSESSSTYLQI